MVAPDSAPASFVIGETNVNAVPATDFNVLDPAVVGVGGVNAERWEYSGESPQQPMETFGFPGDSLTGMGIEDNNFTWEMIGLGLEEPLPAQETIDELYVILPHPISRSKLTNQLGLRFTSTKSTRPYQ